MDIKKLLGKNIQVYRKFRNITQEKLAELINIETNSISAIERGKYFPSPDNLVRISEALEISLSDLFNFNKEKTSEDYIKEIEKNISFLKMDNARLCAINSYIKSLII
ncbi:helix-turn-helix transcriptional regulator [bacterium]|nr:helix-turn-helix transcriptional regulator [bacterium]